MKMINPVELIIFARKSTGRRIFIYFLESSSRERGPEIGFTAVIVCVYIGDRLDRNNIK